MKKEYIVEWFISNIPVESANYLYNNCTDELNLLLNKEIDNLKAAWEDGYKKAHQDIVTNSFSTFEQFKEKFNG